MNSMKRQNDRILKKELPRPVDAQYATVDQWRNNSRKNDIMEPKQKQYPVVNVTGDRSKVQCCKEQFCIGTWNARSVNQGKMEAVKRRWQDEKAKETLMYRTVLWTLWERERVGRFGRMALKHVKYHV